MIKRAILLLLFAVAFSAQAQTDTGRHTSGLRVSLLTCGPGTEEVYEVFGHTAIRIIDSNATGDARDLVYNYGMFNGFDENFELKFMRGKLPYYCGVNTFPDFVSEYTELGRAVEEQVLLLTEQEKEQINARLQWNVQPEHMYYKYDFFFDNCATRIRDIFQDALGKRFEYGEARPKGFRPSYRDIMNRYFFNRHWERVGVNILLGSKIDRRMSNADIMFLPDYLRDGLRGAHLQGVPAATAPQVIVPGTVIDAPRTNWPMIVSCILLALTAAGLLIRPLRVLGGVMVTFLLLLSGVLGCVILVMWFATDHQACANNFNVLWLLPTNLLAMLRFKGRGRHAVIAIGLILLSLLLHVLRVQALVPEFLPLMLALLIAHAVVYRRSLLPPTAMALPVVEADTSAPELVTDPQSEA